MARLPMQETAEYYNWLFRIETQEFEKELLEIVSSSQFPFLYYFKISIIIIQILFPKNNGQLL